MHLHLSSPNQVAHCLEFFDAWPRALVVVDPVMGDNGKLYRSFTREMVAGMERMVRKAQVITPNLTEAAILLGQDPPTDRVLTASARSMLARLGEMGPGMVVITGVHRGLHPGTLPGHRGHLCGGAHRLSPPGGQPAHRHRPGCPLRGADHQDHLQLQQRAPGGGYAGADTGMADPGGGGPAVPKLIAPIGPGPGAEGKGA